MPEFIPRPEGLSAANGYSHVAIAGPLVFVSGQVPVLENGTVVGTGDVEAQVEQVFRNIESALAAANVPTRVDVLTLVHNPGLFRWPTNQAALQFSGHSHGGQVRFPLIGAPVRMSRYTEETVDQPLVKDERVLMVTTGVGAIGLPVRFGVPPEILLVTISNGAVTEAKAKRRKPLK